MKVSREQMAENRRRILDVASRLFKDKGFDAVSVAEVMKTAGLTHGGFYGHFTSKDDLVAQSLAHALAADSVGNGEFSDFVRSYLAPRHRDNPGNGCPTAGLAAAIRHQTPAAKGAMTEGLRTQIARIEQALPDDGAVDKRRAAIGSWAAMIGAVILARAVDDPELSDEVLEQTRDWIDTQVE
ncbi:MULTISPECIES: TetR/AcrR family transcriptional regulator [unclassified Brucella]|jgi:TetR/AcrR family transcriptional repressor of nem operon|uniref:TetR/AcrR family transcriptional regulator n=1 Tax=Brucella/Ochrobactrum group TaxID=2826938 RepID=UPI000F5EC693|nr:MULTISPECIES: TetR/AcrR family transcriptional regulator [unclassified Brucella]RRD25434.1 TetR/AcrR family transcriptional regulator [Brucellaceae bacterium VT-16-1752]WHS30279.1 helix-turn-helix domain-containing protein [Brucella sp. NM4]WHT44236.1 helix-turn-helix domain-containing protein [Ochrobactrum sp. SSR]GLU30142.1 TetR family transcriptional regulator [Brucella sp. NBRC 12950]